MRQYEAWRDSASLSDKRSHTRSRSHLQILRVPMLLRHKLVTLMQLLQLSRVVLDVAPRATRSAPSRRSLRRNRSQTQPLQKRALRMLLKFEMLVSMRRRLATVLLRVLARGGAAAPSVALSSTRRGGGQSAQTHSPSSSSCGSGGAR